MTLTNDAPTPPKAHVIVVGNEKGGAGKTTSAMHLIASLMALGFKVASMDVDVRQLSLTHYIDNRRKTMETKNMELLMPDHVAFKQGDSDEERTFTEALRALQAVNHFVVIDTPGSDSRISRLAHSYADTIITPINDSFVDLDVLARVEDNQLKIDRPGIYSEMIWQQKMMRAKRDNGSINWIVMRNRLSTIDAKNKRNMVEVLDKLAKRIGFIHAPGFGERVVFRELFLQGLTLLDLQTKNSTVAMTMSHVAARQELREFLKSLQIAAINDALLPVPETQAAG
jgi:chromosome partitioning protein